MLRKILIKIHRLPLIKSTILLFCINLIITFLFARFVSVLNIDMGTSYEIKNSFWLDFMIVCVAAPILETSVFQWLIYNLFENKFKKKLFLCCVLGGFIFGILHLTSLMYVITIWCLGFFFLLWYALLARKYNNFTAFCVVAIVHSARNALALFGNYFADYW